MTAVAPEPVHFPVTWNNPTEATVTWNHDRMHFPRPLSPLFQSFFGPAFESGFTNAAQEMALPIRAAHMRFHNGYEFERYEMIEPASAEEAQAMGARAEDVMREAIPRQLDRWTNEYLPRLITTRVRLREMDVQHASSAELIALIGEVDSIAREDWLIHFRIIFALTMSMQLYDELFVELFGGDAADAHSVLVGQASKSVEAGIALSDLAKFARNVGLTETVLSVDPERVLESLGSNDSGRELTQKIRDYLDDYGLRQDLFDFITPTWQEDPSIAIASLQAYLVSGHDMTESHNASVRSAEAALTAARDRLADYPEPVRGQFEALVQAARIGSFLQEEHNFYIDQQGIALMRLFFLRLGARLVADNLINQPPDIFMLRVDEITSTITTGSDVRELVTERWKAFAEQAQLVSPPFIGVPPAGPPPTDNPMFRGILRFFGGPPQQADDPNQLKGNAGSRGIVRGVARVALSLDEAKILQPGEILVTITTMPTWTPLFGTAAAVVTETGGPLSHCAIVAREYAIPAVVGAFGATNVIRTGQTIVVDGDRGIVTLV